MRGHRSRPRRGRPVGHGRDPRGRDRSRARRAGPAPAGHARFGRPDADAWLAERRDRWIIGTPDQARDPDRGASRRRVRSGSCSRTSCPATWRWSRSWGSIAARLRTRPRRRPRPPVAVHYRPPSRQAHPASGMNEPLDRRPTVGLPLAPGLQERRSRCLTPLPSLALPAIAGIVGAILGYLARRFLPRPRSARRVVRRTADGRGARQAEGDHPGGQGRGPPGRSAPRRRKPARSEPTSSARNASSSTDPRASTARSSPSSGGRRGFEERQRELETEKARWPSCRRSRCVGSRTSSGLTASEARQALIQQIEDEAAGRGAQRVARSSDGPSRTARTGRDGS